MWLFLAFVTVPLIEIGLFIEGGGWLGLWPTLLIVILTAMIGTVLVRQQGFAALNDLQRSMAGDGDPTRALAHGAMILASGLLLLTPGFFTDGVGFALLVPQVRDLLMGYLGKRLKGQVFVQGAQPQRPPQDDTIETEYKEIDPDGSEKRGDSGWTRSP